MHQNTSKQSKGQEDLRKNTKKQKQKNITKQTKTGEGVEQRYPVSKERGRNYNEITKGNNSGHTKPRKELRNHTSKHQQQNT